MERDILGEEKEYEKNPPNQTLWSGESCVLCDTTPTANPVLINFFKPMLFMASDSSNVFCRGISHFFTATKNTTERVEGRTNEQCGLGSASSARKGVLCDDFVQLFVHFVDYRRRVFFPKFLQKPLGMPTHL